MGVPRDYVCPICASQARLHDVVDFNKSCEEKNGNYLERSGIPVYYALCDTCGFCFAPEFREWSKQEFRDKIYNDDYILIDPEYPDKRPRAQAAAMQESFGPHIAQIRHLDYGGGTGLMAKLLREKGWDSTSYDPVADEDAHAKKMGTFNLITSFEVFEHVPDMHAMMTEITSLLAPGGIIFISTLLSEGGIKKNHRLGWWYASPRNGHISLFSRSSLALLAQRFGFNVATFSDNNHHIFWTQAPPWAAHMLPESGKKDGRDAG